jgi:hypothetical protein
MFHNIKKYNFRLSEMKYKISVHQLILDGDWFGRVGDYQIRLQHKQINREQTAIVLYINNNLQRNFNFLVSEDKISGWIKHAKIPADSCRYYIMDCGKRYAHIYISKTCCIGTRVGLSAVHDCKLDSRKLRRLKADAKKIRTERRTRLKEKNRRKRLQQYQPTFGFFDQLRAATKVTAKTHKDDRWCVQSRRPYPRHPNGSKPP